MEKDNATLSQIKAKMYEQARDSNMGILIITQTQVTIAIQAEK
jgi:hypothetical protein